MRRGYAVYVVDQPGRGRSGYSTEIYGPPRFADLESGMRRYMAQEKFNLWPQAHLHTQWPGNGDRDDPTTSQIISNYLPEIEDFTKQQFLTHDALLALVDKIGPGILMMHSQAGPFGWPVADARPDLVKAIVGVEPNGPPALRRRIYRPARLFPPGQDGAALWADAVPLTYVPAVQGAGRDFDRAGGQGRCARPGALLAADRSRRGNCRTCRRCRSWC